MIKLICDSVSFYTQSDEANFFNWLNSIECVQEVKGVGTEILLFISESEIQDEDLNDLIAIFTRYNINLKQLAQFKTNKNKHWFYSNKQAFWHSNVFS